MIGFDHSPIRNQLGIQRKQYANLGVCYRILDRYEGFGI